MTDQTPPRTEAERTEATRRTLERWHVVHKPGEPHEYELRCTVCGQLGTIRLSIDPPEAPAPETADESFKDGPFV